MENPEKEIADVVKLLTMAKTPDIQKAALERYFVKEAGFDHPVTKVLPGQNSRKFILGIYQWYRNLSPIIELQVEEVVYDAEKLKVFLRITQRFHLFFSPLPRHNARLLTELYLTRDGGLFYIKQQNDYYQPEEFLYLLIPPLAVVWILYKYFAALSSNILTMIFQFFGFWRPTRSD